MASIADRNETEALSPKARNAIGGAFLGWFVDMFGVYLPIVALAPAIIYFVSPEMSEPSTAIIGALIFVAALLGRPVGAAIFGHYADKIGRKRTAMISVGGFGAMNVVIAALPGYQQWGIVAALIFVLVRFIDGIFIGGEYTSANPLAMEYCPRNKRGLYSGIIQSAFPLSYVAISLTTFLTLTLVPAGDINSPYVQWGWRIPFLVGALMAFAFVLYYYFFIDESELFIESGGTQSPLKELFSGDNLRGFLQVFVFMSGLWFVVNTANAILPGLLVSHVGLSGTEVSLTLIVMYLVLIFGIVGAGVISQMIGRRTFFISWGIAAATVGTFFYWILLSTAPENLFTVILLSTIIGLVVVGPIGPIVSYISERFNTNVRASGYGLGYSLAIIVPSFYAFYQAGLTSFMPFEYTVLVLLVLGGLLIVGGAAWGPETKDVRFGEELKTIDQDPDRRTSSVES